MTNERRINARVSFAYNINNVVISFSANQISYYTHRILWNDLTEKQYTFSGFVDFFFGGGEIYYFYYYLGTGISDRYP